jgi:ankyrin repeat protein
MELEENLRKAATQGNLTLVTKLITQGVNINAPEIADEGKRTALMLASLNGHTAIVKALLDAGADASIKNYYGAPALMFAVGNHYADIVKLLLDARSNPNVTGEVIGMTPLMSAAASSHPASIEIMELLLNAGADIEMKDIRGENALDYARIHDNEQNAKFLKRKIKTRKAQAEAEKFIKEEIEKLKVKDARIKELEAEIERLLKERP